LTYQHPAARLRRARLSTRGARFIGRFEGWRNKPYNDPTNNATIGFGHLLHLGPVTARDNAVWGTITMRRGIQLLQQDALLAVSAVHQYIHRPLAQCEVDALVSFAFNCGGGALAGSVGRAVNASRDPTSALCRWDRSSHVVLPGLLERRKREARLFMTGDYDDGGPPFERLE
jgi:lysozyme